MSEHEDDEIMDLAGTTSTIEEPELTPDDFAGSNFLKNPKLGESITFTVARVVRNKTQLEATDKKTGAKFALGVKKKDGTINRFDIYTTENQIYTIKSWELFFKLLGSKDGKLLKYAETHNKSFKNAKVTVTKLLDATEARLSSEVIMKIYNKTASEAKAYIDGITQAIKEQRLYDVKVE